MNKESFFGGAPHADEEGAFPRMANPDGVIKKELDEALESLSDTEIEEIGEAVDPTSAPDDQAIDDHFNKITKKAA